jgi:hypothetical protein
MLPQENRMQTSRIGLIFNAALAIGMMASAGVLTLL